jgi:hypothetical protein
VWMILAGRACLAVDSGGPRAVEAAVGGEVGQGCAQAFVAGPAEADAALAARCLGDWSGPDQGRQVVEVAESVAGVSSPPGQGKSSDPRTRLAGLT